MDFGIFYNKDIQSICLILSFTWMLVEEKKENTALFDDGKIIERGMRNRAIENRSTLQLQYQVLPAGCPVLQLQIQVKKKNKQTKKGEQI